jgi:large subunit ribosomal protein L3
MASLRAVFRDISRGAFALPIRPRPASLVNVTSVRYAAKLTAQSVKETFQSTSPELMHSPSAAHRRKWLRKRPGLIGVKRGMVPWFDEEGVMVPATVLEIDRVQVTDLRTKAKNGYFAVQLGYGNQSYKRVSRQMLGQFSRAKVAPKRVLKEFRVRSAEGLLPLGTEIKADHFVPGQYVDIQSLTKGKGFAGVMKRWGFSGQPASHGVTKTHRAPGSIGQNQDPGRVLPGKKMAGHMGMENNTIQNARVLRVDADHGLIYIRGPVSGAKGRYVYIADAIKKKFPDVEFPPQLEKADTA